eukprot:SAG31_NODE_1416_length_8441_cov_11.436706_8_plen_97_part_00
MRSVLVTGWMRHGMHDGEQFAQAKASGSLPANPIRSALRMDALTIGYLLLGMQYANRHPLRLLHRNTRVHCRYACSYKPEQRWLLHAVRLATGIRV